MLVAACCCSVLVCCLTSDADLYGVFFSILLLYFCYQIHCYWYLVKWVQSLTSFVGLVMEEHWVMLAGIDCVRRIHGLPAVWGMWHIWPGALWRLSRHDTPAITLFHRCFSQNVRMCFLCYILYFCRWLLDYLAWIRSQWLISLNDGFLNWTVHASGRMSNM